MYSLEDIRSRSKSTSEMVVSYTDAMELVDIYKNNDTKILGWEGWIEHPDGTLGHSKEHQGTVDLSSMDNLSALAFAKATIMQSHTEWEAKPEINDAVLLFCITTNE